MIAFTPDSPSPDPRFADSDRIEMSQPAHIVAETQLAIANANRFRFTQRLIPLDDRSLLRLRTEPIITVNTDKLEFELQEWGIKMPCSEVHDLPRQIGRRFLSLFSKADAERLTDSEQSQWLQILDRVDYTQFSIDRSAPHYTEGTLLGKNPYRVEWHDGTKEPLPAAIGAALHLLDANDKFSAFIKSGSGDRTLSIERVCLLT